MQTFSAFSALHAIVVGVIAATLIVAVVIRRRVDAVAAAMAERTVGIAYLAIWCGTFLWLPTRPDYNPATDHPLQLCHWAAVCAALMLLRPWRLARTLAWFWGIALCTQAVITPNLPEGPAQWPFWFFWITHAMAVGVPLYDVLARGFRPGWRDLAIASAGAALYVAIILPIDLVTGWNYGFVGPSRPDVASIVDLLGPWPRRLALIFAIAFTAMALALLPFLLLRASTRTPAPLPPMSQV
ncbi:MAG TPA: TIGR02206 family membrane protein [Casimicrobiaceae bacterium]|nr:TIGR02206 family membrane protein [Casimicrobiaceae bacterium]